MSNKVDELTVWFAKLTEAEKKEVLKFVYGNALVTEGLYCGPAPQMVPTTRGLHCGPAPTSTTSRCSACGRAF
jgi:hypothetical protein